MLFVQSHKAIQRTTLSGAAVGCFNLGTSSQSHCKEAFAINRKSQEIICHGVNTALRFRRPHRFAQIPEPGSGGLRVGQDPIGAAQDA